MIILAGCSVEPSGPHSSEAESSPQASPSSLSPLYPNEPVGFIPFAENAFTGPLPLTRSVSGLRGRWYTRSTSNPSIVTASPMGPQSPSTVMRTTFPKGLRGGRAPVMVTGWDATGAKKSKLYFSAWVRIEGADYENHPVGTKLGFFGFAKSGSAVGNQGFFLLVGDGKQSIRRDFVLRFNQQYPVARNLNPNVNGGRLIKVGKWQHWEALFEINTPGTPNGKFQMWIDGVKTHDYRDVKYTIPGATGKFYDYLWNPTWGGNATPIRTRADNISIDHIYLSGLP
jgi:hypothetical protein